MTLEASLDALAKELRIMNLIACSEPPIIRDARDKIREHFGEKALVPDFEPLPEGHPGVTYAKVYMILESSLAEVEMEDGSRTLVSREGFAESLGSLADRITRTILSRPS